MGELQKGAGNSTKSFEFFKTQIEKLTDQMVQLEKESAQWKEKSDVNDDYISVWITIIMFFIDECKPGGKDEPVHHGQGEGDDPNQE